ncbi:MAG: hypothetical protein IKO83_01395 [Oscillospiraceae bacterium]|nr:hypothetical protein [Oscillospiraceae bacterium]MBR7190512.1 hypothetical protein [Oscillospiraceae bacterium]
MAIELKLTGMCEGCRDLDLKLERLYTGDGRCEQVAFCGNRALCRRIERHLMKYMDEHPYTGPDPLELDI